MLVVKNLPTMAGPTILLLETLSKSAWQELKMRKNSETASRSTWQTIRTSTHTHDIYLALYMWQLASQNNVTWKGKILSLQNFPWPWKGSRNRTYCGQRLGTKITMK